MRCGVLTIGVIGEGISDQHVIENILLGFFQAEKDDLTVNYIQPALATSHDLAPPGGWTLVFDCLRRGDAAQALQFNDCVVIQIDTDQQEEVGFDVPRREGGHNLSIPDRVDRVIARLLVDIDSAFYLANSDRILFAVAVDATECWLLPLLYDDNKAGKTSGCLQTANAQLRKLKLKGLASGTTKFPRSYVSASRGYRKRSTLIERGIKNPSLALFLQRLDAFQEYRTASQIGSAQGLDVIASEGTTTALIRNSTFST